MAAKIFLIEDDENIRTLLQCAMRTGGFDPKVFKRVRSALEVMKQNTVRVGYRLIRNVESR